VSKKLCIVLFFYCTHSSHLDAVSLFSNESKNPLSGRSMGPYNAGCFWEIAKYAFEFFLFMGWLTCATAMSNPFRCWSDEIDWVDRVNRSHERSQCTIGLIVDSSIVMVNEEEGVVIKEDECI